MKRKQIEFIKAYTTPKQSGFCNATESARIAGYSPKSSSASGCNLLKDPKIAQEVLRITNSRRELLESYANITKEEILELSRDGIAQVGAKHANYTKLIEIICKVKGFFNEAMNTQILIYNDSQDDSDAKRVTAKVANLMKRKSPPKEVVQSS